MFKSEDFQLPLEKVLTLRVITDDIDTCTDVKALQNSLKGTTKLLMTYQHMLGKVLQDQIHANLSKMFEEDIA
jgi:hypothetical protein